VDLDEREGQILEGRIVPKLPTLMNSFNWSSPMTALIKGLRVLDDQGELLVRRSPRRNPSRWFPWAEVKARLLRQRVCLRADGARDFVLWGQMGLAQSKSQAARGISGRTLGSRDSVRRF
jgi:hypothetical protein